MPTYDAQSLRFRISVTEALNRSWNATFAHLWPMLGYVLLFYIAQFLFGLLPFFGVLVNLLSFALCCALFSGFYTIETRGRLHFEDLFSWSPRFGKLLGANALLLLITLVLLLPVFIFLIMTLGLVFFEKLSQSSITQLSSMIDISGFVLAGLIVLALAGLIVLTVLSFAFLFLVQFRDLSITESLKLSISIGRENVGAIILFFLLSLGLALLGFLACCVGVLVSVPLIMGMQYHLLRSLMPLAENNPWEDLPERPE